MKHLLGKFGTDSRFPYWSGAVLDPKFFNGGTALAIVVNWAALAVVHQNLVAGNWTAWTGVQFGLASLACLATTRLIWHSDALVRNIARAFACGLPLVLLITLAWRGLAGG